MSVSLTLGPISAEILDERVLITDVPLRGAEEQEGTARKTVAFSSLDGWLGRYGFFEFPQAGVIIGKFYWHKEPLLPPYDRLKNAGTVSVVAYDDRWVTTLRVLKTAGKPYPTLNRISEEELDFLAGKSFTEFLAPLGEARIGRYGDLVPTAGKNVANGLGISVPKGQIAPLVGMIAVTRPIALIKRFGETI